MQIIKHRKIYFTVSALLVVVSIIAIASFGLKLGIDFTGGALSEITVDSRIQTTSQEIEALLTQSENDDMPLLESVRVQATGDKGYVLRFSDVDEDKHQAILSALNAALNNKLPEVEAEVFTDEEELEDGTPANSIQATDASGNPIEVNIESDPGAVISSPVITIGGEVVVTEQRFESIGPIIGQELKQKSLYAIIAVLLGIILYIAWAFRKVSDPVSSWKYGVTAIIALGHDVIIPTGVFAILGYVVGIEIDILFVTAVLTILGFSVNDTIVVFDRTRENLARDHYKHEFEWIVNKSVNETIRRSMYTSLTTFVVLLAIFLYGGASIKNFVLALMIGVVTGTYSSIFLASPLLVAWEKLRKP
jgi:preprotein translocase SecF subunit